MREQTAAMEVNATSASEAARHARRPMNAFLIFCKRHRAVVRDNYPNLENRSITKILGEWWAQIDDHDKRIYTDLAKQYKDAFFDANPDFKWYKLPAPPLRTLSGRPREVVRASTAPPPPAAQSPPSDAFNNNYTQLDLNTHLDTAVRSLPTPAPAPAGAEAAFTPGKLADEAHMGGLSSLLAGPPACRCGVTPTTSHDEPPAARALQDALSETTRLFKRELDSPPRHYPCTNQDVIDQVVDVKLATTAQPRACKGERYRQFMASGGLRVPKRPRPSDDTDHYQELDQKPAFESASPTPLDRSPHEPDADRRDDDYDAASGYEETPTATLATSFSITDFDLDAKIRALPALDFDHFMFWKRESKRKKRMQWVSCETSAPAAPLPPPRPTRPPAVGSQKRKPRKMSITRLEVNSLTATVLRAAPDAWATAAALRGADPCPTGEGAGADLFALSTLAEVAASVQLRPLPH